MSADLLLTIDNGTQSVRALVFDVEGNLVARNRVPIDDYAVLQPGWHEYDAERFWSKACEACRGLWYERPDVRERIAAVAVTAQRGTVVALDRDGRPLRAAITWLDQRKSPVIPDIGAPFRAALRLARAEKTVRYFQREAEANWIAACEPELWQRTHKFLLLSGYLNYRLSGRFVDSVGSQVGYLPFDFKKLRWAGGSDWKWQALRVKHEMLPLLVAPATVFAEVTVAAADETGIPSGTPIVAAAADKACEVLGAGCMEPSEGCLSYGTTATINVTSSRYVEAAPLVPPYPAAIPDAYDLEVQIFRGYWMVSWFKEQFGWLERAAAQQRGVPPEALFDELISAIAPGAMGLMLQPYWSPGLRMPEAKGAIVGFGDVHTRAHVYRAILEGLAYALREGLERIERRARIRVTSLRVCGGGSQSDAALQITSDVFGLPVARPHVYETSGLGAAIDAAVAVRLHAGFPQAVAAMTRSARVFEPDAENRDRYEALYQRVYKRMYERLKPLNEAIRDIIGYPPE